MKHLKIIIIALIASISVGKVLAQQTNKSGVEVGFQLNNYANDFGIGLNVTSPRLFGENIQLKSRFNAMFFEYVENAETTWEPYFNIMLGSLVGSRISNSVGLYGEGGFIVVLPSDQFSSKSNHIGGYGVFGFEFYFSDNFTYFFEAGGIGIGAEADRVENQPIYSNGFLTSVGCRAKF